MAESTEPRTRVELLLMELLYQRLTTDSDPYIKARLAKAGLSEEEIKEIMHTRMGD